MFGTPCSKRPCPRTVSGAHSWSRNDGQQCGSCGCWKSSRGQKVSDSDEARRARLRRRKKK